MKLLFDHNISPDLISRLSDLFPESEHVYRIGLHETSDADLWTYARDHEFVIVSKDADFSELSMIRGFPPKLLWLRIGNCRTMDIDAVIRRNYEFIRQLIEDDTRGILQLFRREVD